MARLLIPRFNVEVGLLIRREQTAVYIPNLGRWLLLQGRKIQAMTGNPCIIGAPRAAELVPAMAETYVQRQDRLQPRKVMAGKREMISYDTVTSDRGIKVCEALAL